MTKFHMTKFHNLVKDTETISTNVTALQEANKLSPLLLSFSSPFLLRPVSPPACLLSPIVKQLVSLQQESRLTFLPNLNRFTLELKKSLFLENHHTVLKAMYAVWKRQTCRHRGRKDVTFPESVACHFYLKNWKLYMEKEFPIQFKPFAEQNWSSKNMLLASAPHFTHAAPSSLMWTPDAQKSSRWTSWPAGRCWWPGSSWPSIEICWLGSPTTNFGLS